MPFTQPRSRRGLPRDLPSVSSMAGEWVAYAIRSGMSGRSRSRSCPGHRRPPRHAADIAWRNRLPKRGRRPARGAAHVQLADETTLTSCQRVCADVGLSRTALAGRSKPPSNLAGGETQEGCSETRQRNRRAPHPACGAPRNLLLAERPLEAWTEVRRVRNWGLLGYGACEGGADAFLLLTQPTGPLSRGQPVGACSASRLRPSWKKRAAASTVGTSPMVLAAPKRVFQNASRVGGPPCGPT